MRRTLILSVCTLLLICLTACNKTVDSQEKVSSVSDNFTDETIDKDTAGESTQETTTAADKYTVTPVEELPDFLAKISDKVYLNSFSTAEWSEVARQKPQEQGFHICVIELEGVRHRAIYNDDGLVIMEKKIIEETDENILGYTVHYEYTVRYNGMEQILAMNESLSIFEFYVADINCDGVDEYVFYTPGGGPGGKPTSLHILHSDTLERVEIEYSQEFFDTVVTEWGIAGTEITDDNAVVTVYLKDYNGAYYEGAARLVKKGNFNLTTDMEYDMHQYDEVSILPVYENTCFSGKIRGLSVYEVTGKNGEDIWVSGKLYVDAVMEYNQESDCYLTKKITIRLNGNEETSTELIIYQAE